jgi:hypothetical protein
MQILLPGLGREMRAQRPGDEDRVARNAESAMREGRASRMADFRIPGRRDRRCAV